jgi:predicted small lipoprotein YifL
MRRALLLLIPLLTALTACGTRGPLTLPPPAAQTAPKPPPSAAPAPANDLNTARPPSR